VKDITPLPLDGTRPPPGKGRLPNSTTKNAELIRAGLRNALEILRNGQGENPIEAAQKIARFLEGLSQKRLESVAVAVGAMKGDEFDRVVNTLYKAAQIQLRLADYVFPKPGRIDVPEPNGASGKGPATIEELAVVLQEKGLPSWVFGTDMPTFDLEAEIAESHSNGNGNGNG